MFKVISEALTYFYLVRVRKKKKLILFVIKDSYILFYTLVIKTNLYLKKV